MRTAAHAAAEAERQGRRRKASAAGPKVERSGYPIGQLARLAGVSTRTVRYYEEIGLLRTARRYAGGRRVFGHDALERLRFIGRLKRLGFALEEIRHLNEVFALHRSTAEMLHLLDRQLVRHIAGLDERMQALQRARADLVAYHERIGTRLSTLE